MCFIILTNRALPHRFLYQTVHKHIFLGFTITCPRSVRNLISVNKSIKQLVGSKFLKPITFHYDSHPSESTKSNHNQESIWTIPNCLCILRISLSPVFGYLTIHSYFVSAVSILIVAAITDFLDGIIARSYKSQSSRLGSFLDPLADKILVTTLFCSLTYIGLFPGLLTAIIVFRDVILLCGGFYIWLREPAVIKNNALSADVLQTSAQLKPSYLSKINTAVQLVTGIITLISPILPNIITENILNCFWYATGVSTVTSAISYLRKINAYKLTK